MSDFTPEGKPSFPNLYADSNEVHSAADEKDWPQERLDYKTDEYGAYLQRKDLMPRARAAANKILDYLLFEMACRDDIYKLEDEVCGE